MKFKLSKSLTAILTVLILVSCFVTLYNIELTSAEPGYTVVFTETGLPAGTSWSVTFNGVTKSTTDTSIDFTGFGWSDYSYTINSAASYVPTPSSGSVTPTSGNPIYRSVTYEYGVYTLDISSMTGGTTSPAPGSYQCVNNQNLTLSAIPDAGYHFLGWTVNGVWSFNENPLKWEMNNNYQVQAIFEKTSYNLIIITSGQGTVTPGNSTYYYGETVDLTATAADGWSFLGWGGQASGTANTTITMNDVKIVVANFIKDSYALTTITIGQGTVTPGNKTYAYDTSVTLTATPADGWTFSGWSGDATGTTSTTILMDNDKTVTATFKEYIHVIGGNISKSQYSEFSVKKMGWGMELVFTVTGKSGDYGTSTIVVPKSVIQPYGLSAVDLDGVNACYPNFRYTFSSDEDNFYFTYTCHFSTHTITLEFSDTDPTPTPAPTDTPAPTETPTTTPAPTAEPTTNPTVTPIPTSTTTPTTSPTTAPTTTPTTTPTTIPTPTTIQPTTQPTTTSDLTVPIAGVIILLVAVLAGLIVKNKKHKPQNSA